MKLKAPENFTEEERIRYYDCPENRREYLYGARGGWEKFSGNPVLGGEFGTCFDMCVLREDRYKMWFSWRPHCGIGYTESADGIHWDPPRLVLSPVPDSPFEPHEVTRPVVLFDAGVYKMWYGGHVRPYREDGVSVLCYAESADGVHWERPYPRPVLTPQGGWEQSAVMCPYVLHEGGKYRLWYSAGSNHEPDAIGYAESPDGLNWERGQADPILTPDPAHPWEQHKVVACQVLREGEFYYMFYVGHMHEERAGVGIARSRDGVTGWEKCPENPILSPTEGDWDSVSVYKPFVLREEDHWKLWYNGAQYQPGIWVFEQIGLATYSGRGFGF